MVTDEMEKGLVGSKGPRGMDGVCVAERLRLLYKSDITIRSSAREGGFITGRNDHGDFTDTGAADLIEQDAEHGPALAIAIDHGLQRQRALRWSGRGYNSFLDLHRACKG